MKNIILRVAAFSIVVGIIIYSFVFVPKELLSRFDFTAFMTAANMVKAGEGRSLYQIPDQMKYQEALIHEDSFLLYRNPPHLTLFFLPFAFFDLGWAYKFYVLAEMFLLAFCAYLISKNFRKVNPNIVFFLTLFFIPSAISVITGQISLLLLIILLLAFRSMMTGNSWSSGFLLGLLFVKPQYLLVLPFIFVLAKERKNFVFGVVWSLAFQVVLFILLTGVGSFLNYPGFLFGTESFSFASDIYAQASFTSLFFNLAKVLPFLSGLEKYINMIFYFLTLLGFVVLHNRYHFERERLFYSAILFTLAYVPHFWEYDLVLTLPAVFFFLTQAKLSKIKRVSRLSFFAATILFFSWTVRFLGYPYVTSLALILAGAFGVLIGSSSTLETRKSTKTPQTSFHKNTKSAQQS